MVMMMMAADALVVRTRMGPCAKIVLLLKCLRFGLTPCLIMTHAGLDWQQWS